MLLIAIAIAIAIAYCLLIRKSDDNFPVGEHRPLFFLIKSFGVVMSASQPRYFHD
jgi:hypothetical protein